jgi:hypothetical protein
MDNILSPFNKQVSGILGKDFASGFNIGTTQPTEQFFDFTPGSYLPSNILNDSSPGLSDTLSFINQGLDNFGLLDLGSNKQQTSEFNSILQQGYNLIDLFGP